MWPPLIGWESPSQPDTSVPLYFNLPLITKTVMIYTVPGSTNGNCIKIVLLHYRVIIRSRNHHHTHTLTLTLSHMLWLLWSPTLGVCLLWTCQSVQPGESLRQSEYIVSNYTVNTVNTVNVTRQGYVAALTTNKGWTLITGDQTTDGGDHNTPRTIPQTWH